MKKIISVFLGIIFVATASFGAVSYIMTDTTGNASAGHMLGYGLDSDDNLRPVRLSSTGAADVTIQDNTAEPVDIYLCKINGTTTPTSAISVDDRTIEVASNTGAVVGDCVNIGEDDRLFQSIVTNISGTTITISSPCDNDFTTSASVCFGSWNLNVDGSGTPVEFSLCAPTGAEYDIYAISLAMGDKSAMDDTKFGGLTALSNGIVGRRENGYSKNLFVISNNAGFRENGFDTEYPDKVPTGDYAFWANKNYTINNGVALRIVGATGDKITIIVQDNLTGLDKLAIVVHGHVVTK